MAPRLKLLQDICGTTLQFPESYWIDDVTRERRIGAGAEATIYKGTCQGRAVVIREFHPPEGGNWQSSAGHSILQVYIFCLVTFLPTNPTVL